MGHQLLHIDVEEMGGQRGRILRKRWEVGLFLAVIEIEITISRGDLQFVLPTLSD